MVFSAIVDFVPLRVVWAGSGGYPLAMMDRSFQFLPVLFALLLAACATVDSDMENTAVPEPVVDDRPLVTWNRLMGETLPVVTEALAEESPDFRARAFVLSREGGVRSVHMAPSVGRDDKERVGLLFDSIDAMMSADAIVAFVVYAPATGRLINAPEEEAMLVAHLEHMSGRALLRKFNYVLEDGSVELGPEEVDQVAPVLFGP